VLWSQIKHGKQPEHIGIILDGNRRWAFEHSKDPWKGHQFGADTAEELLDWCLDLGIKSITVYAFSMQNFQRPSKEIDEIMRLMEERLNKLLVDERIHNSKVQVKIIGRRQLLPHYLQDMIERVEKATAHYYNHYLNMAIAYGGRAEIIDATKKIVEQVQIGKLAVNGITEDVLEQYLYTAHLPQSEPDLILRTSGEERLSGFMIWQCAYSELCFIDVFWPDFRRIDFWRVIRTYQKRDRRRGR
jgi:tritrans,polycis-undecaprenyl-diphosphate synthase [geranylgeranyl-diphosphate specific]